MVVIDRSSSLLPRLTLAVQFGGKFILNYQDIRSTTGSLLLHHLRQFSLRMVKISISSYPPDFFVF